MSRIPLRFDAESDGDSTHQPSTQGQTAFRHAGPEYESLYRQKLGQQLMVDIGNAVVGKWSSKPFLTRAIVIHVALRDLIAASNSIVTSDTTLKIDTAEVYPSFKTREACKSSLS